MLIEIEAKREQMIKFADLYGISSKQVLQSSQELDLMIALYHAQKQKQDKRPKSHRIFRETDFNLQLKALKKAQ